MNVMKPKRKRTGKAALTGLLLLLLGSGMMAQTYRATLPPVEADSFYAIDLPAPLIGAARDDLADLRIRDEHGREVAYFVREATSVSRGRDFEPYLIELIRRTFQTDIRIQTDGERISSFMVRVKHADTDKKAILKGSNDGESWYAVRDCIRLSEQAEVHGTEALLNDYTHFCPTVPWVEIHQIHHSNTSSFDILYHQSHLFIRINITRSIGDIIMQKIAGIWHIDNAHAPRSRVVLDLIKHIEILWLHGP